MTEKTQVSLQHFIESLPAIYQRPSIFLETLRTMPKDHPADHEFESGSVPGVCKHCGFIQADIPTDCDCGHDLRWHAEHRIAPAMDEEAGLLTAMGIGDEMEGVPSFEKLEGLDLDGLGMVLEIG